MHTKRLSVQSEPNFVKRKAVILGSNNNDMVNSDNSSKRPVDGETETIGLVRLDSVKSCSSMSGREAYFPPVEFSLWG